MKKRILSFVLAICLLIPGLFAFAGCNDKPDAAVGTYHLEAVQFEGQEETYTKAKYQEMKDREDLSEFEQSFITILAQFYEQEFSITLKKDKTFSITEFGETADGTWTRDGNAIKLTATVMEEKQTFEATFNNTTLTMADNGVTFTFKKA